VVSIPFDRKTCCGPKFMVRRRADKQGVVESDRKWLISVAYP
jgi:hypothetical protein